MILLHEKGNRIIELKFQKRKWSNKLFELISFRSAKLFAMVNNSKKIIEGTARKKPKDVQIIFVWKTSKLWKKEKKDSTKFMYTSPAFFSFISNNQLSQDSLIEATVENLIENYEYYQTEIADESPINPLYKVVFKFIW